MIGRSDAMTVGAIIESEKAESHLPARTEAATRFTLANY